MMMNSVEAKDMVEGNELSFLRIDRAEINFPKSWIPMIPGYTPRPGNPGPHDCPTELIKTPSLTSTSTARSWTAGLKLGWWPVLPLTTTITM